MAKVFLADTTRWFIDGHASRPRERWTVEPPVKNNKRAQRRLQKQLRDRRFDQWHTHGCIGHPSVYNKEVNNQPTKMDRLAQLQLVSKTRGVIVWTFWRNESDVNRTGYVASSIDAYGNTNTFEYQTMQDMREGYNTLRSQYGYTAV